MSARTRILAAVLLLLALSTAISTAAIRQLLLARVGERVERSLVQEVEEFRTLVNGRNPDTGRPFGDDVAAIFDAFLARNIPIEGETIHTFLGGRPYKATAGADRTALERAVRRLATVRTTERGDIETPRGTVRFLAVPVRAGRRSGVFVITIAIGEEREEVTEAVEVATGVSVAVLLLASLLAFFAAGRVLAPLREVRDTAQAINETDLARRIEVRGSDEIADLARTFNAMLDRLQAAFAVQKELVSDAGHELRTPITIIRGHLELLGDDPDERRETVELVCDELDRMARFVDDLLLLARAEQPDFLHLGDVDLDALTDELMAKAAALAPRDWQLGAAGTARLVADRQRLTQAVMQLASNAVQHTGDGDRITLGSASENGHVRLWVADTGPGVPEAERRRIFDRFARGTGTGGARRSEGAGLGLAIVRAIAVAHGGRVDVGGRPGEGATFTIVIPTTPGREHR